MATDVGPTQIARACKAVKRLQAVIPSQSKSRLLSHIRQYLSGESTPEEFADVIKDLVDEHGIVIPLNDMPIGGWERPSWESEEIKTVSVLEPEHRNKVHHSGHDVAFMPGCLAHDSLSHHTPSCRLRGGSVVAPRVGRGGKAHKSAKNKPATAPHRRRRA